MIRCAMGLTAMAAGLSGQPALAQSSDDLAAKFGALEAITTISLSPDGHSAAFVTPGPGSRQAVMVADLVAGGAPHPVLTTTEAGQSIRRCAWSSNVRVVCNLAITPRDAGELTAFTRTMSVSSDGHDARMVTPRDRSDSLGFTWYGDSIIDWNGGQPDTVLMTRQFVPERDIGKLIAERRQGIGVEQVNVATLSRTTVVQPQPDAVEFIADGEGQVRIRGIAGKQSGGYERGTLDYQFRKVGSQSWQPLGRVDARGVGLATGFDPYAIDPASDSVFGFDTTPQGLKALYRIKLDGSAKKDLVLGRDDVDVDDLVRIGRKGRVIGASYATDRRTVEYFDPALRSLAQALGRALPGTPQMSFVDASEDESKLLVLAGSDVDPGKFYVLDRGTHHLEEILAVRPQLAGIKLAEMRPITFPARDGTKIPGYLTVPTGSTGRGLPAIVMPHGGPGARDEWGFDWLVQYFAARGYAVLQPNYRGSTGYGAKWYQKNGFQSWRTAIGDVDDAGRWLVGQGIAAPGKLVIFGWSYGGYAALQSGVFEPGLFKAIVAVAPVTDLEQLRQDRRDYSDYTLLDSFIGQGEHVRSGSPAANARAIHVPVLMFQGDLDLNVPISQSRLMAARLREAGKSVELVEFPGLAHSLEDSIARTRMLSQSDAFLRKAMGI